MQHTHIALALSLSLGLASAACSKPNADAQGASPTATVVGTANVVAKPAPRPANAPGSDANFTCNSVKQNGMCVRYDVLPFSEINEARKSCNEAGEEFSITPCPAAGLLGACKMAGDEAAHPMTMFLYKSQALPNVKVAKELCTDGKFTAVATPPAGSAVTVPVAAKK